MRARPSLLYRGRSAAHSEPTFRGDCVDAPSRCRVCARVLLATALLASAPALSAQSDSSLSAFSSVLDSSGDFRTGTDTQRGCFDSITPGTMHRELVFLQATMPAHTDSAFILQANLMAQEVATEVRALLGAHGADVPIADSIMAWYAVPSFLTVIAHADGHVTHQIRSTPWDTSAAALLARAFDAARAHELALMIWPEHAPSDSVIVRLSLRTAGVTGKIPQVAAAGEAGMRFTVFTLLQPETFPAVPMPNQPPPRYPTENESSRVGGFVLMQLVVDTSGRAVPASIRDLWPANRPRLRGYEAQEYNAFVRSTTYWLEEIRFRPARIGTCRVRQLVQQPLEYKVVRP